MYIIFYKKTTSEIIGFREDFSTPALSIEQISNMFFSDLEITDDSVDYAVLVSSKLLKFASNKYLYNKFTNEISLNPNYIPPNLSPDITE